MALQLIEHGAAALTAATASGRMRGVAGAVGHAVQTPPAIALPKTDEFPPGRVVSGGQWQSSAVHGALSAAIGPALAPFLRQTFEWYFCRGAFFHNDAHYDNVLFGVWCVAGPPRDIVFPRANLRLDASPGHIAVFDPFEVHGVVAPGHRAYAPDDYADAVATVFIGFEVELMAPVALAFRLPDASEGRMISSRTRIASTTGALS